MQSRPCGGFLVAGDKVSVCAARAYLPYLAVLLIGLLVVAFVPWITLVVPRLFNL